MGTGLDAFQILRPKYFLMKSSISDHFLSDLAVSMPHKVSYIL